LLPELIEVKEKYNTFMSNFERIKAEITMRETTLGLKNQEMREAEVIRILDNEGLLDKKLEISNNYYRIKIELDYLLELSSNYRALIYEERK